MLTSPHPNSEEISAQSSHHRTQPSPMLSQETARGAGRVALHSSTLLHRFSPAQVIHPESEPEILQVIQNAASRGIPVRAIGSMHSYAPIFATEGICVVLDRYNRLVQIQGELVTVEAGMKISALNELLANRGLALPIVGAIDQQTVSGAILTGTHGGSLHHPSMSGYVHQLRLIRADGSVLTLQSSQPDFQAVAVSMGLLGLISTVTFRCVPAFDLQGESQSLSMDELFQQFDHIHQNNQYVDIEYVPITDNAQVLTINRAAKAGITKTSAFVNRSVLERKIKTFLLKGMLSLFQHRSFNWLHYLLLRFHETNIYPTYQADRSDRVLTNLDQSYYDPIPLNNMEVAVPYHRALEALQVLRNHFRQTQRYPNIFIRIRCSAADNFWLSPAYKQTTCWLDFREYPYTGAFFSEVIKQLEPLNIKCHWGKENPLSPEFLKQRYEKWDDFLQLRQAWDPQKIFRNDCLDFFFDPGSKSFPKAVNLNHQPIENNCKEVLL